MTYNITSAEVGVIIRSGKLTDGHALSVKFQNAEVTDIELNGIRYYPNACGDFEIPISALGDKNSATAFVKDGNEEREIILEEFGYNAREKRIKPLWNREIVAGFATIGSLIDKIAALQKRVRRLEKMIEPGENDLCI